MLNKVLTDVVGFLISSVFIGWIIRKLPRSLVDNAMTSYIDNKIGALFGLSEAAADGFLSEWIVPILLGIIAVVIWHRFASAQYRSSPISSGDRFSAIGIVGNGLPQRTWVQRVEPSYIIILGLVIALGGVIWQMVDSERFLSKKAQVIAGADTGSRLIANATAVPPAKYNKAQIGKILEAIDVFHTLLLRIGRTLNDAKGMTGSLEGIVSSQGAASFLEQMNGFRLMYLSPSDDFDKAYQDYSLYTEVTRVVAEKQLHHDPLFAAYNDLAGLLRDIPDKLAAPALTNIVKAKKDTFKTRVDEYLDWVTAKKKALEEYREWYLRRPTTD